MEKTFAAFIMTYRRPAILATTIQALYKQTLPPTKILIVDNDPEQSAKGVLEAFPEKNISYYAVGHNSGPAGAAYWGMKLLFEEGWEWVLCVDDDDPPKFPDQLESVFSMQNLVKASDKIAIMGAVGVRFNSGLAKTIRVPDGELSQPIIEVDMVASGQFPFVHRRVFEAGLLPKADIFFGFEDLEMGLRIKSAGFKILLSGQELKRQREQANRMGYSRPAYKRKNVNALWREYYSNRTLAYVLRYNEKNFKGVFRLFLKGFSKSVLGFRYGLKYGFLNAKFHHFGFWDGIQGKLGIRFIPKAK